MTLADVRDYVESLKLADHVYMGKMPDKQDKSIGVYNSKHQYAYSTAIGGPDLQSYGTKYVTLLVHWTRSPRETEEAAAALFEDVGTDDAGIYEMVIEAAVIYQKERGEQ